MVEITVDEAAEVFQIKPFKIIRLLMDHDRFVSADSRLTVDDLVLLNREFPLPNTEEFVAGTENSDWDEMGLKWFRLFPDLMNVFATQRPKVTFTRPVTGWQIVYVLDKSEALVKHCFDFLPLNKRLTEKLTDDEVAGVAEYFEVDHSII